MSPLWHPACAGRFQQRAPAGRRCIPDGSLNRRFDMILRPRIGGNSRWPKEIPRPESCHFVLAPRLKLPLHHIHHVIQEAALARLGP